MRPCINIIAAAALTFTIAADGAWSQSAPVEPDVSHSDPATAAFFAEAFAAKSAKDVAGTMSYFSRDLLTYGDATVGMDIAGFAELEAAFAEYMPDWGEGLSYPLRIVGGPDSAMVLFTDTPELWGADLRILGAIDLEDGKIIRWVDYFDSATYAPQEFADFRTPQDAFPTSFSEAAVVGNAAPKIVEVAKRFQQALASEDAAALAGMLAYDAVYEDLALHTQVMGRPAIEAYLARILPLAPFGAEATLRHIVGGDQGGGFEWIGGQGMTTVLGATALELNSEGKVSRITTVYDRRQLEMERAEDLTRLSITP